MKRAIYNLDGHNFSDYPIGGQLSFQKALLSYSSPLPMKLVGLSSSIDEKPGIWASRLFEGNKYPFFPVGLLPRSRKKSLVPTSFRYTWGMYKYRHEIPNGQIIYSHNPEMLLPLLRSDHKLIYHIHGSPLRKSAHSKYPFLRSPILQKGYVQLIDAVLRRADQLIWVSSQGYEEAASIYPFIEDKSEIIPVFVDTEHFKPRDKSELRLKLRLPLDQVIGVYVGRLNPVKGVDLLLQTVNELKKRDTRFHLLIVGSGELESELVQLSRSLGITEHITFTGQKDRQQLAEIIGCADLAMFASHSEGFPIAMLECMACGVPVFTTPAGEAARIIQNGVNGFLIPERSAELYSEILTQWMENGASMVPACIETASRYSGSQIISKIHHAIVRWQ
jgi:glycosyltransferase involved in cell wall biosynthesis